MGDVVKTCYRSALLVLMALVVTSCTDVQSSMPDHVVDGGALARNGFTEEGVASLYDMMDAAVEDRRITAAVAMLARERELAWVGTSGEMQRGVPMRDDAILPLASVGKMFTAVARNDPLRARRDRARRPGERLHSGVRACEGRRH